MSYSQVSMWLGMIAVAVTVGGMGCNPPPAVAPRKNLQFEALKEFSPQDIEFYSNQFFLWPEGVAPEQVSRVLALSDEIERLQNEIQPLEDRIQSLNEKLKPSDDLLRKKKQELSSKISKLKKKNEDLKKKTEDFAALNRSQEEEKKKEKPDAEILKKLETDGKAVENQITEIQKEVTVLDGQRTTLDKEVSDLSNDPDQLERESLKPKQKADEELKSAHLEELMGVVTWYDPQPSSVKIRFEADGTISILIQGWSLNREEEKMWDFSTQAQPGKKPSIRNVSYNKQGGLFEFTVDVYEDEEQTRLRESYLFHIARYKYAATDGKVYYTGNMDRTRLMPDGSTEVRKGIAKLVDKRN